jgi:hypothetical protein
MATDSRRVKRGAPDACFTASNSRENAEIFPPRPASTNDPALFAIGRAS